MRSLEVGVSELGHPTAPARPATSRVRAPSPVPQHRRVVRWYAVGLLTVAMVVPFTTFQAGDDGYHPVAVVIAATFTPAVVLLLFQPSQLKHAIGVVMSVAVVASGSLVLLDAQTLARRFWMPFIFLCIVGCARAWSGNVRRLVWLLVALHLIALFGELLNSEPGWWVGQFVPEGGKWIHGLLIRNRGLLGHPLYTAVSATAIAAYLLVDRRTTRPQRVFVMIFVLFALQQTGSRSPIISLVVALSAVYLAAGSGRVGKLLLVGGVIGVLVVALVPPVSRADVMIARDGPARVLQWRLDQRDNSLASRVEMTASVPLTYSDCFRCLIVGAGQYGLSAEMRERFDGEVRASYTSDNQYLTVWYDFGFPGLAVVMGLLLISVRGVRAGSAPAAAAGALCVAVAGVFLDHLYHPGLLALMIMFVGELLRQRPRSLGRQGDAPSSVGGAIEVDSAGGKGE